ncbi:Uu.00g009700.m01.CDS01 [Anthostomella pinea]|uniref:Uu.00g009700.m01.CDS01 n=1 Tax=Anthostomella pinea TaxID=933095 RepID=A0AAI8VRP1_9PEZI|nr:Uu.00g009700.m01.CDS01 [Anthostomella pinea]
MRSALLPSRRASHLCDACKQQHRNLAISSLSPLSTTPRQLASPSSNTPRTLQSLPALPRITQSQDRIRPQTQARPFSSSVEDLRPRVPSTHYEFFPQTLPDGPPPNGNFVIDVRALRREFLKLQGTAHPDMHPQHLKGRAEATSARINEAFKTLESPLLRAQYILSLRGIDVANDETAKVEDPELLMEVLETRETIEEAQKEEDLEELKVTNEERARDSEATLEQAFREDDVEAAKAEVVRLRYWINIRESIHNWEKGKPVVLEH